MFSRSEIVQRDGQTELQQSKLKKNSRKTDLLKFAHKREERHLKHVNSVKSVYKTEINTKGGKRRVRRLRDAELHTRSSGHSSHVYVAWGLNRIDISMCVLFYIVCTGILVLLYFHLSQNYRIHIWKFSKKKFWTKDRVLIWGFWDGGGWGCQE